MMTDFELVKWAAALVALGAFLLTLLWKAHNFLDALGAVWRPVAVLLLGGVVLLVDDQGEDLGVSLLSENRSWPIFFLFFALLYWAANTWHSARLGLHAKAKARAAALAAAERAAQAVGEGEAVKTPPYELKVALNGDEHWLYWPPRLLGVFAHGFAALNLKLAASQLPAAVFSPRWLAWAPLAAVVFATVAVGAWDVIWSKRYKEASERTKVPVWKQCIAYAAFGGAIVMVMALLLLVSARGPAGFVWATWVITGSASLFLFLVACWRSHRWRKDDATEETVATWGLFGLAFVVAARLWFSPVVPFSQALGSMVVIYFAFGAILAAVNYFEWWIKWFADRPFMKRWFHDWATPRALGGAAAAFLIAFGVVNARLHPFHRVRLCDADCKALAANDGFSGPDSPADRPSVADAAKTWYAQAKARYGVLHQDMPVPMVIVAAAGGGIRAAYWTATVLEKLEHEHDIGSDGLRPYLFAISGVSGGSVGASAFEAALAERDGGKTDARATRYLTRDFLAPAIASLIFRDVPAGFLPYDIEDRGVALERSFEEASHGMLAHPFLSLFRTKGPDSGAPWWRPILLLNATHEETGNRIITSPVRVDRDVFVDAVDALHELNSDVPASTAAHNSARFLYVSPAGDLGNHHGSVIDGGYFENYGALTALEIGRTAKQALKGEHPGIRLVYLLISSDPSLDTKRTRVRIRQRKDGKECLVSVAERENVGNGSPNDLSIEPSDFENSWINEFLAPVMGLASVRAAAGNRAAAELAVETCGDISAAQAREHFTEISAAKARELFSAQANDPQAFPKLDDCSTGSSQIPPVVWLYNAKTDSCGAKFKSQLQTSQAEILTQAGNIAIENSNPFEGQPNLPYFAHLAMCRDDADDPDQPKPSALTGAPGATEQPLQPPLGWVLSEATQDHFGDLLGRCGNAAQITQLEAALGKPAPGKPQQQEASAAPPGN
jgi:hypothetical protein